MHTQATTKYIPKTKGYILYMSMTLFDNSEKPILLLRTLCNKTLHTILISTELVFHYPLLFTVITNRLVQSIPAGGTTTLTTRNESTPQTHAVLLHRRAAPQTIGTQHMYTRPQAT